MTGSQGGELNGNPGRATPELPRDASRDARTRAGTGRGTSAGAGASAVPLGTTRAGRAAGPGRALHVRAGSRGASRWSCPRLARRHRRRRRRNLLRRDGRAERLDRRGRTYGARVCRLCRARRPRRLALRAARTDAGRARDRGRHHRALREHRSHDAPLRPAIAGSRSRDRGCGRRTRARHSRALELAGDRRDRGSWAHCSRPCSSALAPTRARSCS
jgi:hypothetical protein